MKKTSWTLVASFLVAASLLAGCGEKSGEAGEATGKAIGTEQIGTFSVTVTQQSDFKPGGKTKFFVKPTGGQGEPTAVRAWFGSQSGEGSLKGKANFDAADGDYDATVEIPATPAADAKLWVEVEAAGAKNQAGFNVQR